MASQNARGPGKRSALGRVHDVAANAAGGALIIITVIVLAGVVSRATLGRPIAASNELVGSCLMVALVYLSLSSATHLRITVITTRLPARWARRTQHVVLAFSVAGLALAAWAALETALVSFRTQESTVGLYTFDIAPFRFLVFIGVLLLLLRVARERRAWLREEHQADGAPAQPPEQGEQSARSEPSTVISDPSKDA